LRLHVFGHVHEGRGIVSLGNTTFVNAYAPPVVIRLER
jgi:Icc-related predicted phosphoesterase